MNDRNLIALLVLLIVVTATVWFRYRHLPWARSWLIRHLIGNFVLIVGLFAAWRYDLPLSYYLPIMVGAFAMWTWGTWKLRHAVRKNEVPRPPSLPD